MKLRFSSLSFVFFTLLIAISPNLAHADASPNDEYTARQRLTTSRGLALANALVASAHGTSAVWHNPAAIADAMMYATEATYRFNNKSNTHGVQVNLFDSKSNQFLGAELGYIYEHSNINGNTQNYHNIRLGLATSLGSKFVSLGVTGDYQHLKLGDNKLLSQFTMDAGLNIKPVEGLTIAFTAQNLIVGDYKHLMPRMISTGIAFSSLSLGISAMFEASFNLSADDIGNSGSYGVALEYVLASAFPIRLGYRYNDANDQHVFAAGLAWRDKQIGLDLSYQHLFEPLENDIFQAGLSLYF